MGHLSPERLVAAELAPEEQAHLTACVRCRAERRYANSAYRQEPEPASAVAAYNLGRVVASGGMGVVFEARHAVHGTRHAIKVLRVPDPALASRLVREGHLQARVVHPNLLGVDEVLELDGSPALVMPFVDGPTLAEALARGAPPPGVGLALFHGIARGVAALHRAGLIHRDLKPSNVLLDCGPRGVVPRVADFGLAKELGSTGASLLTATGALLGTPSYAAPEQLVDAARADARADVFALGALLYELLTGRRAFPSSARAPPELAPVPDSVRPLVGRCLALDPSERPDDAASVLAALGEPPATDPTPWVLGADPERIEPPVARLPDRGDFVGREGELAEVSRQLSAGRWVALVGEPGWGRTRLLVEVGRDWRASTDGGSWWVSADGGPLDVAVAEVLGVGLAGQIGRALAEHGPALLLIDDLAPASAPLLRTWLDGAPRLVAVVVTTEEVEGAAMVPVGGLDPEAGRALVAARAADRAGIERLVADHEGAPLALELLARFAGSPVRGGGWEGLFEQVSEQLSAPSRAALGQLALFAGPFSLRAAEEVVAVDGAWVPELAEDLVQRGWVRSVASGDDVQLTLHPAVRTWALASPSVEASSAGPSSREAVRRHAGWAARHGGPADRLAAAARLADLGEASAAAELACPVGTAAARRVLDRLAAQTLPEPTALAVSLARDEDVDLVSRAERVGDPGLVGRACLALGLRLAATGARAEALVWLGRAAEASDPDLADRGATALASVEARSDRAAEAARRAEGVISRARARGSAAIEADAWEVLASAHRAMGRPDAAAAALEQARDRFDRLGDRPAAARALAQLGDACLRSGRWPEAEQRLGAAHRAYRALGELRGMSETASALAGLWAARGQRDVAEAWAYRATGAADALGDPQVRSRALRTWVELTEDRPAEAREHLARLALVPHDVDEDEAVARARVELAAADPEAALAALGAAPPSARVTALGALCHARAGRAARAHDALRELERWSRGPDPATAGRIGLDRAETLLLLGDPDAAVEALAEAQAAVAPLAASGIRIDPTRFAALRQRVSPRSSG